MALVPIIEGGDEAYEAAEAFRTAWRAWQARRRVAAARHAWHGVRRFHDAARPLIPSGTPLPLPSPTSSYGTPPESPRPNRRRRRPERDPLRTFGEPAPSVKRRRRTQDTTIRARRDPIWGKYQSTMVKRYRYSGRRRYRRKRRRFGKRSIGRSIRRLRKFGGGVRTRRSMTQGYWKGRRSLVGPTRAAPRYQLTSWNFDRLGNGFQTTNTTRINLVSTTTQGGVYYQFVPDYRYVPEQGVNWQNCGMPVPTTGQTRTFLWKGIKFMMQYTYNSSVPDFNLEFFMYLRATTPGSVPNPSDELGRNPADLAAPFRLTQVSSKTKVLCYKKWRFKNKNQIASANQIDGNDSPLWRKFGHKIWHLQFKQPLRVMAIYDSEGNINYYLGRDMNKAYDPNNGLRGTYRVMPSQFQNPVSGAGVPGTGGDYDFIMKYASFSYTTEETQPIIASG